MMTSPDKEILAFLQKNHIFEGFSAHQLALLASNVHQKTFKPGEIIIHENELSDKFYIIKEGEVEVYKEDKKEQRIYNIAVLHENAVIGEFSLLDNKPRSASVRAKKATTLLIFSFDELRQLSEDEANHTKIAKQLAELADQARSLITELPFFYIMLRNIAKGLGNRIRDTNQAVIEALQKDLEHTKARLAMGILVIAMIVGLTLYVMVIESLTRLTQYQNSTVVDSAIIAVFTSMLLIAMIRSGYPLELYGVTVKNWRASLRLAVPVTIILMVLTVLLKFILMHTSKFFAALPFFDLRINSISEWIFILIYVLFVPLQELIVRGCFQSSFQHLFIGKHNALWAILLSNLLFSSTHFHFSEIIGTCVLISGFMWGWMYSRYPTLVGVTVSHQIVGVFAIWIVGFGVQ